MLLNPSIYSITFPNRKVMPALIDLTNKVFGRLTILKRVPTDKIKPHWKCACECGNSIITQGQNLKSGDTKSCGCLRSELLCNDLTNEKFGKLTVIEKAPRRGKSSSQFWLCECSCGKNHIVSAQHLTLGQISSCGKCISWTQDILKKYKNNFLSFVNEEKNGCWIWKGRIAKEYGIFWAGKFIKAHRFSFLCFKGQINNKSLICHTCDTPSCVNPEHLYQGTHKDNARDRDSRNRQRKPKSLVGR